MTHDVYCNLHKMCASVKALDGPDKGHVIATPRQVLVHDVTFHVLPGGLARAQREGVRNVHAYARGTAEIVDSVDAVSTHPDAVRLHYNAISGPQPGRFYRHDTGAPVASARVLAIDGKRAYIIP